MPISRGVFESSGNDLQQLILDFLRFNTDAAFTADEVVGELRRQNFSAEPTSVRNALEELIRNRRIETRVVLDKAYYAYSRAIGFRTT